MEFRSPVDWTFEKRERKWKSYYDNAIRCNILLLFKCEKWEKGKREGRRKALYKTLIQRKTTACDMSYKYVISIQNVMLLILWALNIYNNVLDGKPWKFYNSFSPCQCLRWPSGSLVHFSRSCVVVGRGEKEICAQKSTKALSLPTCCW